jgi:hypothetical protein
MNGDIVSTGRKSTETELRLAKAIGMVDEKGFYKNIEEVLTGMPFSTVFTQPPRFSTDKNTIYWMDRIAKEKFNVTLIKSDDPEVVANDLLSKISN